MNPWKSRSLPAAVALFLVLQLTACQTLRKPVIPDVPTAMTAFDLALIDKAIADSPNSLAVFNEDLAAAPLEATRSGVIVDLDRQRAYVYSQTNLVAATRIASGKAKLPHLHRRLQNRPEKSQTRVESLREAAQQ